MKNLILVVNYKKKIFESDTIKSLLESNILLNNNYDVLIWDNLPVQDNERIKELSKDIRYIPSKNNETLSKIYNKAINEYIENYEYLFLFDNDSKIKKEYFEEFEKESKKNLDISLFVPKVINKDTQVRSPRKIQITLLRTKEEFLLLNYCGRLDSKNLFAINSGMIIKVEYLKKDFKGYDERIRFYGTDDYFVHQYSKTNKECFVLDYILPHEFALSKMDEPINNQIWRYRDCQNGLFIRRKEYSKLIQYRILLTQLKSGIWKSIKSKNIGYLKSIFEIWLKKY